MSETTVKQKFVKCHVKITMKPIEFVDQYFEVPNAEKVLEHLLECLENRHLDSHFNITVTPIDE